MANITNQKCNNEPISIAQIYETIQARSFIQELFCDLISDLKEKPTYKRVKRMVDSIINNTVNDFVSGTASAVERLKWRTALTDISIMTYTVDTVFSEVLYRKLQNEFPSIIAEIVQDLQSVRGTSKQFEIPSSEDSMLKDIESIISKQTGIENNAEKPSTSSQHENLQSSTVMEKMDLNPVPVRKRGRPKKGSLEMQSANPENETLNPDLPASHSPESPIKQVETDTRTIYRPKGRVPMFRRSKTEIESMKEPIVPVFEQTEKRVVASKPKKNPFTAEKHEVSDVESEVSMDIGSVSSVHTSELSDFEDTVSISSGDEDNSREKKCIPLKLANELYTHGKLGQIYTIMKKNKLKASAASRKLNSELLPSKRARKPNTKYQSETMFSDDDYSAALYDSDTTPGPKKNGVATPKRPGRPPMKRKNSAGANGKISRSPVSKKSILSSKDKSPRTRKHRPGSGLSSPKNSTKRYDSSDLYKPRTHR